MSFAPPNHPTVAFKSVTDQLLLVHDNVLGLSVLFNPATFLPYMSSSLDNHPLFGLSTYDILLTNYTRIGGVLLLTRPETILHYHHFISDYVVSQVLVNPSFNAAFDFDPLSDRLALKRI